MINHQEEEDNQAHAKDGEDHSGVHVKKVKEKEDECVSMSSRGKRRIECAPKMRTMTRKRS